MKRSDDKLLGRFSEMWHQVAGHKDHGAAPGFLMGENGLLYKNISHDIRGQREEEFYKRVFSDDNFSAFRDFIPTYYQTVGYRNVRYLELTDACHGFKVPCGADIKLGTVDFCSLDSAKKKQIHREKDSGIQRTLGFRFLGANVYSETDLKVHQKSKEWGLGFTVENAALKTEEYLDNNREIRRDVLLPIISDLSSLVAYYSAQRLFWLCRCSLLVVYDGVTRDSATVKLIDFAHNTTQDNPTDDTHVDTGLVNLLDILSHIKDNRTRAWENKPAPDLHL